MEISASEAVPDGLGPVSSDAPTAPPTAAQSAPYSEASHDELVRRVRLGTLEPIAAIEQVDVWLAEPLPGAVISRLVSDRLVWLAQAFAPEAALESQSTLSLELLHDYALYVQIGLARQARRIDKQGDAVQELLRRDRDDWQARVQEVIWLNDQGDTDRAEAALDRLSSDLIDPGAQEQAALLELEGLLAEARQQPTPALRAYSALLQLQPQHRYGQRTTSLMIATTGGASVAWQQAQALEASQPGSYSVLELARLRQQATGQELGWNLSTRSEQRGPQRQALIDPVVADLEEQLSSPALQEGLRGPQAPAWYEVQKALVFDWYIAMEESGQCRRVLRHYESWSPALRDVTLSARRVVGDCYSQSRQPLKAIPLYEAALGPAGQWMDRGLLSVHYSLTYAYVDVGAFEQSQAFLDTLLASTSPTIRQGPAAGQANPDYSELLNLQAMSWLYMGQVARADDRVTQLADLAPRSASFQLGAAETSRARQRPEASMERLQAFRTDQPDNLALIGALADTHRELHQWGPARLQLDRMIRDWPDEYGTQAAARRDRVARAAQLEVEGETGFGGNSGSNSVTADRDYRLRARLSSALARDAWRVFAEQSYTRSSLDDGSSQQLARTGIGLVWDVDRWRGEAQVHQATRDPYRTGGAGRLDLRASDQWDFTARVDSNSTDIPWRAREANIGAREAALGASYTVHESRRFIASGQFQRFSDSNRRTSWLLGWEEGWIQRPRWQFATRLDLGFGHNSADDAVYFNPSHDSSLNLANSLRILQWRDADRQMNHLVQIDVGGYRQSGYDSKPAGALSYGHEWNLGQSRTFSYGALVSTHPYDGRSERNFSLFFKLSMALP